MTAYLSFVIDSLRMTALVAMAMIPTILVFSSIGTIGSEGSWRDGWKRWALIGCTVFAAALVFVVVVPDAETRKVIAIELKGGDAS